jgi:putative transposase
MQYRRINAPGGTFFFTLVTYERRQIFGGEQAVILLRNAFRSVLQKHPCTIEAAVVLPDHLHMIWRLPENDGDYATRWRLIKNDCWVSWRSTQPTNCN